jgi:osmotically-inducible protein OsmY
MRISTPLVGAVVVAASLGLAACGQGNNGANNNNETAGQHVSNAGHSASNAVGNAVDTAATATSDTAITSAVKSKLLANSSTSGMDIHVETNNGVVTLHGTVQSDAEKATAERIARNTKGVKDVTNNLEVGGS